jgi:hypothetical protein
MKHHLVCCALAFTLVLRANAALMLFDFNDLAGGITAVTEYQTTAIPVLTLQGADVVLAGQAGVSYTDGWGTPHTAGKAASWGSGVNDAGGNQVILHFDATGFQDFSLRYDYRSTSTGCPSADFQYRVGGSGDFVSVGVQSYTCNSVYHAVSVSLASLTSLNGAASVDFRWVLGPGSGSGTFQLDNLELSGAAIPEPAGCALLAGVGCLVFAGYQRWRLRTGVGTAHPR